MEHSGRFEDVDGPDQSSLLGRLLWLPEDTGSDLGGRARTWGWGGREAAVHTLMVTECRRTQRQEGAHWEGHMVRDWNW